MNGSLKYFSGNMLALRRFHLKNRNAVCDIFDLLLFLFNFFLSLLKGRSKVLRYLESTLIGFWEITNIQTQELKLPEIPRLYKKNVFDITVHKKNVRFSYCQDLGEIQDLFPFSCGDFKLNIKRKGKYKMLFIFIWNDVFKLRIM